MYLSCTFAILVNVTLRCGCQRPFALAVPNVTRQALSLFSCWSTAAADYCDDIFVSVKQLDNFKYLI